MKGEAWEWAAVGRWLPTALLLGAMLTAWRVLELLLWRPRRMEEHFSRQGINGPPYRFFFGNLIELYQMMLDASSAPMSRPFSHGIVPRVLPFFTEWSKIYGSIFLVWFGRTARLTVAEPDLIKEILVSTADAFDRIETQPLLRQLEGEGLLNLQGEKWAHHRKLIAPLFYASNLRPLIPVIARSMAEIAEKWAASPGDANAEVEVLEYFDRLSGETASRAILNFGFEYGEEVIRLQDRQISLVTKAYAYNFIPGSSFFPTKRNATFWKLNKKIKSSLARIISLRKEQGSGAAADDGNHGKDLLDLLLGAADETSSARSPAQEITPHDIVEECKTLFFAGRQTVSVLLTWVTLLLAMYPDWQDLARQEVLLICGSNSVPSAHCGWRETLGFSNFQLTMIIHEVLRLYPPTVATTRTANTHVKLGGRLMIPRGMQILIPILVLHHDKSMWGEDADEFKPGRFANGVAQAAAHPAAFIPFGHGVRSCPGQSLALLEAKIYTAILLQRFSFRLSPAYVHAPRVTMMLNPQHGAPVVFKRLPKAEGEDNSGRMVG